MMPSILSEAENIIDDDAITIKISREALGRNTNIQAHVDLENGLQKQDTMDKKIKKIEAKEKGALKETKELLKMDKKQDRKMKSCDMKMKKKKK